MDVRVKENGEGKGKGNKLDTHIIKLQLAPNILTPLLRDVSR
jgi:hypothetical protein